MDWLTSPESWIALLTLTVLEIVLGIDNVIFISILSGKLPEHERKKARLIGLGLALGARILLLLSISWVMRLQANLFSVFNHGISGKDLVLILGGLFLVAKATHEIHSKLEHDPHAPEPKKSGFTAVVVQIVLIDIVFSLDSVITAVGMVDDVAIMIAAVVVSIGIMIAFAGRIGIFVERHPTIKMLALSFLILIGVMLVAQGFDQNINKGYIYFAMAFSLGVELLNMRFRGKALPN